MRVSEITAEQHLAFIASRPSVSFLQTPAWGQSKAGWIHKSVGWFEGEDLVGAGLLLLRKVPRFKRYLAYFPEGPNLEWISPSTPSALAALVEYLRSFGVFQVKIGPHVPVRQWGSETLKLAISEQSAKRISDVKADVDFIENQRFVQVLRKAGWTQENSSGEGFGDFQPRFVFQVPIAGRTEDELFARLNQLWRRNIRKAEKEGVAVRLGSKADLALFHACYLETAKRDKFVPRPLAYFENMWDAQMAEDAERVHLYIAEHPEHIGAIAATILARIGNHAWYLYGASTTASRDLRPSNAVQWRMIQDSRQVGCAVYDMRGIANTLDSSNHLFGLIQFKLGTGGFAQEYVGEWDYVLSRPWAVAFALYMKGR